MDELMDLVMMCHLRTLAADDNISQLCDTTMSSHSYDSYMVSKVLSICF